MLEKIPTARDPWQIINMTPGVQAGLNVGGSASGQQVGLVGARHLRQRAVEPRRRVDHRPVVELLAVVLQLRLVRADPGDHRRRRRLRAVVGSVDQPGDQERQQRVQGLRGRRPSRTTRCRAATSREELFNAGANGFLSGNPLQKIDDYSVEYGGPIMKNKLWFWARGRQAGHQRRHHQLLRRDQGRRSASDLVAAQKAGSTALKNAGRPTTSSNDVQKCLSNDKTVIKDLQWKFNYQLNAANKFQYLFQSDNKYRNAPRRERDDAKEATTQQTSDKPWGFPLPTHSLTHTLIASDKLVFNNQFTYVYGGFFLDYQDVPPQGNCAQSRYTGMRTSDRTRSDAGLSVEHPVAEQPDDGRLEPLADRRPTRRSAIVGSQDGRHLLPDPQARRRPLA